jgi:hypothetical protein
MLIYLEDTFKFIFVYGLFNNTINTPKVHRFQDGIKE